MKSTLTVLMILLIIETCTSIDSYKKVINTIDPEAKCLDGTSPFFYFHQGSQKNKFLIYFIGGGLCSGYDTASAIKDCYKRSKTQLGSSQYSPQEINPQGMGILTTDSSKSKFANWTKLIAWYCDGSLHQGLRKNPISYKGQQLYFRGAANSRAIFTWLQKNHDFSNADKVVISGGSAGGIATYLWGNYASSRLQNPSKILLVPDSGVFLQFKTYKTHIQALDIVLQNNYKLANIDQSTPFPICNGNNPGKQYKCIYFTRSFMQVSSKILLIQSQYDGWVIPNTLQVKCLSEGSSGETLKNCNGSQLQYIQQYRESYLEFLEVYTSFSKNSVWSIGCSNHGYVHSDKFYNSEHQTVNNMTIRQAIQNFVFNEQRIQNLDMEKWPANKGCSY